MQLWSVLWILNQKVPNCYPCIIYGLQSCDRWTAAVSHSDLKEHVIYTDNYIYLVQWWCRQAISPKNRKSVNHPLECKTARLKKSPFLKGEGLTLTRFLALKLACLREDSWMRWHPEVPSKWNLSVVWPCECRSRTT